jgi:hypothetical protein
LSPEQKYFRHLVNFYSDLGKKQRTFQGVARMYGVKRNIGYKSTRDMIAAVPPERAGMPSTSEYGGK